MTPNTTTPADNTPAETFNPPPFVPASGTPCAAPTAAVPGGRPARSAARTAARAAAAPETSPETAIAAPAARQRPARARKANPTPHKFRRVMGTGHLFRQTGRGKSKNWSMQFYDADGVKRIKTSGTRDKTEARAKLNEILAALAKGETVDHIAAPRSKVWTFDNAKKLYLDRLVADGKPTYKIERIIDNHLRPAFGDLAKFADITAERIVEFEAAQLRRGLSRATVNWHLAALRRMFRLSAKIGKVAGVPDITTPDPKNARKGFFNRDQFDAVAARLPLFLRLPFTFAYLVGWRLASEVLILPWEQIDRANKTVRLEGHQTKNGEGRIISYAAFPALAAVIDAAWAARADRESRGIKTDLVFPQDNGRPLVGKSSASSPNGKLQPQARAAFNEACKAAGVAGRKPHDMRRTAARNLVTIAGVPEKLAMAVTGHLTRAVFDRYHIVNPADVGAALGQLAATDAGAPVQLDPTPGV